MVSASNQQYRQRVDLFQRPAVDQLPLPLLSRPLALMEMPPRWGSEEGFGDEGSTKMSLRWSWGTDEGNEGGTDKVRGQSGRRSFRQSFRRSLRPSGGRSERQSGRQSETKWEGCRSSRFGVICERLRFRDEHVRVINDVGDNHLRGFARRSSGLLHG